MTLPVFDQGKMGQRKPEYMIWTSLCVAMGIANYVELGAGSGHYLLDAGIKTVIGVDVNHTNTNERHNFYQDDRVWNVTGDSHDPQTMQEVLRLLGGPPDAVFIDADHSYDAVRKDFEMWYPVARRLVGFHDILIPDIVRLWGEISLDISSAKIIGCDRASAYSWQGPGAPSDGVLSGGGIGVLFK
jgi:methyltransferase family protein